MSYCHAVLGVRCSPQRVTRTRRVLHPGSIFMRRFGRFVVLAAGLFAAAFLAARGETPAAFGRRCIPADCVAPPSNIPDILGRRALSAGRLAALGATPDFHHGLLTASAVMVLLLGVCGITAPRAADAGAPALGQALQKNYGG